jgi:hypothetical protein
MKAINSKTAIAILFLLIAALPLQAQNFPDNLDIIILADVSGSMEFSLDGCNWNPGTPSLPGSPPYPGNSTCTSCPGICSGGNHPNPSWQRMHYIKPGLNALSIIFQRLFVDGGVSTIRFAFGKFPGDAPNDFSWLEQNSTHNINLRDYNSTELANIISSLSIRWAGTPIGTAIGTGPLSENSERPLSGTLKMFNDHAYSGTATTGSMVLLFTDGKRYGGLDVYDTGFGSGSGEDHVFFRNDIDQDNNARPNKIKIVSLGFGDFSGADSETDFAMLKDISKHFDKYDPDPASPAPDIFTKKAINAAFPKIWGTMLSLTDPSFLIKPDSIHEHSAYVTEYDDRLLFLVSWNEPRRERTIHFTIRTASDTLITPELAQVHPYIDYDVGETVQMYTIQKQFLQYNRGTWKLVIDGRDLEKAEWCAYSILGRSGLQLLDVSNPPNAPQFTGDSLRLKISLTAQGNPIPDARMVARITGPEKGAGNWFAEYPLTRAQIDSVKSIRFPGHVEGFYKKSHFMRHLRGVALPGTKTFEIQLSYDQSDRLYHGKTPPLMRPGIYEVEVMATHRPSGTEKLFRRDLVKNYVISVKPELKWIFSSLKLEKIAQDERFDVYRAKFIPKDKYSNFIKPGVEESIKFQVKNASLSDTSTYDDLQGSYYRDIRVSKNSLQPTVQIRFNNFVFHRRDITVDPIGDNWRINPNAFKFQVGTAIASTDSYNPGIHVTGDFNRQINRKWAWFVRGGYSEFKGKGATPNLAYWNFSANIRWLPRITSSYRISLYAGGGPYWSDQGSSDVGYNLGVSLTKPLKAWLDLELIGEYNNTGNDFSFVRTCGGVLFRR